MNKDKILNIVLGLIILVLIIQIKRYDTLGFSSGSVFNIFKSSLEKEVKLGDRTFKVGSHQSWVSLTVAESKRLIAIGLSEYPPVKECMKNGKLILTKGTTNTYVAEELLHDSLTRGEYVLGYISPAKSLKKLDKSIKRKELVFVDGELMDVDYSEILPTMREGDIVIKGANIINHQSGQAAVMIGSATGGTVGKVYPIVQEKKLRLIIPVGLEKESSQNIDLLGEYSKIKHERLGKKTPWLWSIKGELFTEIEAIKQFADVEVVHYGSGGIGGAEGAVSLLLRGSEVEVAKALDLVEGIQGEPSFMK